MSSKIIIGSSSDNSSSDSIPSPLSFSPGFRRPRTEEAQASRPAKKQRVSALEERLSALEQYDHDIEENLKMDDELESSSERNSQESNGHIVEHKQDSHASQEENGVKEENAVPGTNRDKAESLPPTVSDEDPKQTSKELTAARAPQSSSLARVTNGASESTKVVSKADVISDYVELEEIPKTVPPLDPLSPEEMLSLENALQFDPNDPDDNWQEDWSGNVALLNREVTNPHSIKKPGKNDRRQALHEWAQSLQSYEIQRLARSLLRYVYNVTSTPPAAKRILANAYHQSLRSPSYDVDSAIRRVTYDPAVLREDGWITSKAPSKVGATGGPFLIGTRVFWQGWEAIVIAYLHDNDIGDLWKCMWFEGNETFDIEAEELQDARKRWERRMSKQEEKKLSQSKSSARFASAAKFSVEGIEHGIVMAKTYDSRARHGLFWPPRVRHISELDLPKSQPRRSSSKQKLQVVFLAPYWNSKAVGATKLPFADSLSLGPSAFSSGALFEFETVDASDETIQPYPYGGEDGLNVDDLKVAFRFTGLPKNAFSRFLDSHRLALALRTYAQQELKSASTLSSGATAELTDTHPLAIEAAKFPASVLHIPFAHILSKLPRSGDNDSLTVARNEDNVEPTIQLRRVLRSMEPPECWGRDVGLPMDGNSGTSPKGQKVTPVLSTGSTSPVARRQLNKTDDETTSGDVPIATISDVASQELIRRLSQFSSSTPVLSDLLNQLSYLLDRLGQHASAWDSFNTSQFLKACLRIKSQGEDTICSEALPEDVSDKNLLKDWRKACENIYNHATVVLSSPKHGNASTVVISDPRCNEHLTNEGCVERPVRLPAALKGARQAATRTGRNVDLLLSVGDDYMKVAEMKVIGMAHSSSYVKRMRQKCSAIEHGERGVPLTDDSNLEGGEDTKGSRGTFSAAVAGVAAAIKGVDMIVGGQCVNAFCATRPPGHHAGRELHPMKAISNGFCIFNNAACAALYATTPISEQGLGLKRVCVIDIDLHHGNGTQDILCETYDPRFLYVSMHAGGAHINGRDVEDDDGEFRASVGSQQKEDAIFPGRCGDTSPHKGVLNIPLGARVNPQEVGGALVSLVGPAVSSFAPDLIIVSAGFDAHKNDPLGMGGLSAEDFGHLTDAICTMAHKICSGRVLSILEGGYGVPCCVPQKDLFLPSIAVDSQSAAFADSQSAAYEPDSSDDEMDYQASQQSKAIQQSQARSQAQPKLLDLGDDLPQGMDDQVPAKMHKALGRCHAEGFVDCVREHVSSFARNNDRRNP